MTTRFPLPARPPALRLAAIAAVATLFASPARALPSVALGVEAGTLGLGAQATVRLLPWLNLRATGQGFSYSTTLSSDGLDYDAKLKLQSYGAMLDFYPLTRGPRLSVGMLGNGNKVGLHANCANGCTADDITIQGQNANLDGSVRFSSGAPYAGLGWGNAMAGLPFFFSVDLGVMFQGSPKVALSASGTGTVTGPSGLGRPSVNLATDPQVQSEVAAQQQQISDDLSNYRYYPVLGLTLGWRF